MNVKIKKLHPEAVIPTYAKFGDAGLDLTAISVEYKDDFGVLSYNTGLSIEIPECYVGLLFPRSSIYKKELTMCNSVGVIDSGYRGTIKVNFNLDLGDWWSYDPRNQNSLNEGIFNYFLDDSEELSINADVYAVGDKIAQLIIIPIPQINLIEVDELSYSERGEGGFGSTGK